MAAFAQLVIILCMARLHCIAYPTFGIAHSQEDLALERVAIVSVRRQQRHERPARNQARRQRFEEPETLGMVHGGPLAADGLRGKVHVAASWRGMRARPL